MMKINKFNESVDIDEVKELIEDCFLELSDKGICDISHHYEHEQTNIIINRKLKDENITNTYPNPKDLTSKDVVEMIEYEVFLMKKIGDSLKRLININNKILINFYPFDEDSVSSNDGTKNIQICIVWNIEGNGLI